MRLKKTDIWPVPYYICDECHIEVETGTESIVTDDPSTHQEASAPNECPECSGNLSAGFNAEWICDGCGVRNIYECNVKPEKTKKDEVFALSVFIPKVVECCDCKNRYSTHVLDDFSKKNVKAFHLVRVCQRKPDEEDESLL